MEGFSDAGAPASVGSGAHLDHRTKLQILGAIMLALFLGALDQTIVSVAMPVIATELNGLELYTWVTTIYLLTSTITVPFYGKLSDLYGRRPLLMIGITLFLIGSALSGLSQTMEQLVFFRGVQGLGAGALFPISLAIIGDLFTPAERGKYQGLFGAVFGLSAIVGPALGGFITDAVSWHWIFYINLPLGLVSLWILARYLPTLRVAGASRSLDYLGALVFTVGVSLLLLGLSNKQAGDWTDPNVGGFVLAGLVLSVIFFVIEARATEPIVPPNLFRNRTYAGSIVATFLTSFGFFGAIIFLPLWFQSVQGSTPTESGYQIMPLLIGLIGGATLSGALVSRTGRYKVILLGGLVLMAVALTLMTQLRADTPLPVLWAWMFLAGLGIGPTFSVFTVVVQNAVPIERLGVATSNLTFFRQIGGSVGLAIVGTMFATSFREQVPVQLRAQGTPEPFVQQFQQLSANGGGGFDPGQVGDLGATLRAVLPPEAQPFVEQLVAAIQQAFSLAIASTFWLGVAAVVGAIVATATIAELPLRNTFGPAPASASDDTVPETGDTAAADRHPLHHAPAAD
jgi:EmrB/QacA subfamily drug resistance transporter